MWKCHKCGKPVYFAERKQSLGYDWHPECLRCEECGKRLDPGQHAEHKGVPYCHVPCYGALFGPQLFGHGTRVESHKSFGQKGSPRINNGPPLPRSHLDSKLKVFNQFYDGRSGEIKSREVNGRLVLEGALRIYWGVQGVIHLKEDDDQRTVVTVRKRNSCKFNNGIELDDDDIYLDDIENLADLCSSDTGIDTASENTDSSNSESQVSPNIEVCGKSLTLPPKLDVRSIEWDELDDLLQVERKVEDADKLYQTMPVPLPSQSSLEKTDVSDKCSSVNSNKTVNDFDGLDEKCVIDPGNNASENKYQPVQKCNKDDSWIEQGLLLNRSMSGPDCLERIRKESSDSDSNYDSLTLRKDCSDCDEASNAHNEHTNDATTVIRRAAKTGSTAIKRRSGKRRSRTKLKRRCSINGHFYNRETSFFTPPHGSQMSVWITSLVNTQEVINLMLEKYKVDSKSDNFALFVVRDNGEQRRLRDEEYPLLVRVLLGPHEDVVKLFIMDRHNTPEVSNEVAQFLNLSLAECRAILDQYKVEEEREVFRIKEKYREMRKRIKQRMEHLKVRL